MYGNVKNSIPFLYSVLASELQCACPCTESWDGIHNQNKFWLLCLHVSFPTSTISHISFVILFNLTPLFLNIILVIPLLLFNWADGRLWISSSVLSVWGEASAQTDMGVIHTVYTHTLTLPAIVIQATFLKVLRGGCADSLVIYARNQMCWQL